MVINLYNSFHLGDSVFIMILFYNIKDYIENNNIIINYYCLHTYHNQLNEFICSNNIKLLDFTDSTPNIDNAINVWIGSNDFQENWFNLQ